MARASLDYSGLDRLTKSIQTAGGDVQKAAVVALERTHEYVTTGIEQAMQTHKVNGKTVNWEHTGETKKSLRKEAKVEVNGNIASVKTGFEWPTAAKYLAYGRGTPRKMAVSSGLKTAIDSKKLREKVLEIQEGAMEDFIADTFK